jgi:aspartyl-tRNA(Asn)/glutamyl-tRNA(Gln) amidotransferase subunit C
VSAAVTAGLPRGVAGCRPVVLRRGVPVVRLQARASGVCEEDSLMISRDDVRHVARLARLRLEAAETERMTAELARILEHIDKIAELDLAAVAPTAHVLAAVDVLRPDKPRPSLSRDEALRNAPAVSDDCFRVPRMQS